MPRAMPKKKQLNEVGQFIAKAREGKTLHQVMALAEKAGVPFSYEGYRKIEKGTVTPSREMLRRIAVTLNLDLKQLIKISEESYLRNQIGGDALTMLELSPEMYEIDTHWRMLSEEQRKSVLVMMKGMTASNPVNIGKRKRA